jgi:uncharacterized membrane protein YraQ (UPF0718 family)
VKTLGDAVNLFRCCVFTWNALGIVLPAFLIAGALVVFVPSYTVMKYLGAKANRILSYGVSAISGNILTVCSCNVVPIFAGILRRGAGIGPAFCFVFAAPAIHIVNTVMTYQAIGLKLALWRFFAVPIIAVLVGLSMALLFRGEERRRQQTFQDPSSLAPIEEAPAHARRAGAFLGALILVLIYGAATPIDSLLPPPAGQLLRLGGVLVWLLLLTWLAVRWFGKEEAREWGRQTWLLLRMILPIFIPAVIVIALIVQHIPFGWIAPTVGQPGGLRFGHPQGNGLLPVFLASVFSTLMYFPMLTEVLFTKGLLLKYFALGPALAILLGGPGLSLPGLLLVSRVAGWKKTLAYWLVMVLLVTLVAWFFGSYFGRYECSCQRMAPAH